MQSKQICYLQGATVLFHARYVTRSNLSLTVLVSNVERCLQDVTQNYVSSLQ